MINPFSKLVSKDRDVVKKNLENKISKQAWSISRKVMIGKLKKSDIDDLELLYEKYYLKFPNLKNENKCKDRINKLRTFSK